MDRPSKARSRRSTYRDANRGELLVAVMNRPADWRVVKEKRATFAATPAQLRRRPGPVTAHHNLFLAGDWTDTGWPSTIEGAIRSGFAAAQAITG